MRSIEGSNWNSNATIIKNERCYMTVCKEARFRIFVDFLIDVIGHKLTGAESGLLRGFPGPGTHEFPGPLPN